VTPDQFDRAGCYLLRQNAEPLLAWLLDPAAFDFVQWLDTRRLPWPGQPERACDTVAHLRDLKRGGVPWALVVELQTEPDIDMFGRLLEYLGKLRNDARPTPHPGDRFQVGGVVVYLTGQTTCAGDLDWPEAGVRTLLAPKEVHLAKRLAADVLDAVERGEAPVVALAWVPLMQGGDPGIIQRWLHVASREPDAQRRADLGLASLFAEKAGCDPAWDKALEGWNMTKSIVVERWMNMGGLRAKKETLLRVARKKFAPLPEEVATAIEAATESDKLDAWAEVAALVATLDDFRQQTGL
jgi:hypothetical protein